MLGPSQLAMAGALSGVMTTVVMAPGERIKSLLQVRWDTESLTRAVNEPSRSFTVLRVLARYKN